MDHAPFGEDKQLYSSLAIKHINGGHIVERTRSNRRSLDGCIPPPAKDYLPGEPRVQLNDPNIGSYLKEELVTDELDRFSQYLWLVSTQDSKNVSSLTAQIGRGRQIIVTEEPGLHLVWYYDRIFVKPLPKYLLSHAFWQHYLVSAASPVPPDLRRELRAASLGFVRSYAVLIRHRSDFDLAQSDSHRLLPRCVTRYPDFVRLMQSFEAIDDASVAPRYHFGELRLSRLNFWVKVLMGRFAYHQVAGQYATYFARFYGPLLFIFAGFSALLSAMQVVLAVNDGGDTWETFEETSRGFSVFVMFVTAIAGAFMVMNFAALSSREVVYALKDLYRKKHYASL